ncbi:MAG: hypothetical protein E6R04_09645 [Spirochaetes bacterium]|nr:MAG: hypothetical protein E6R04_09645 [Spirochaetota bacterium]
MAEPRFAVRASAHNAYKSLGDKNGTVFNTAAITADAGYLGGYYWDLSDTAANQGVCYCGTYNTPATRQFSVLQRFAPTYTGVPAATRVLLNWTGGAGNQGLFLELRHNITSGALLLTIRNASNTLCFNAATFGNWTTNTANTEYDFLLRWDGTTTANACKLYIDGTLFGQITAANAMDSGMDDKWWKSIAIGIGSNSVVAISAMRFVEYCIWDELIDPTSVALVGGTGQLNGESRTAFVDATNVNVPPVDSRGKWTNR